MSEEKRKSARTQGRFSGEKEFPLSRPEKEKQKNPKTPSSDSKKGGEKNNQSGSKAAKVKVQYQNDSTYSFKELEKNRKPRELRFNGVKVLSETENGESRLISVPDFMCESEAAELMTILNSTTTWHDKNIIIHGQEYPQPRLVAWYGPLPYTYSGATLEAKEMPSAVYQVKNKVEEILRAYDVDVDLNSVLLNLYRSEKDSVAWHSDDELSMGICPTIASVSLGAMRRFEMRPKSHVSEQMEDLDEDTIIYVNLTPGSLIIMDGCMQKDWQHRVPKEYHSKSARINLTFRTVYSSNQLPPEMPRREISKSIDNMPVTKTVQQMELNYDSESFPPLETTVNNKKRLKSKKEDITNDSFSSSSKNSQDEKVLDVEITSMEHSEYSNKNQNNLNKEIDSCSLFESSQSNYDEKNNFNLTEPEKSSGSKFSPSDELMDEGSSELEISQTHPSNVNCVPAEGNQVGGIQCTENDISRSTISESKIDDELPTSKGSKSLLNANAPDFIPHAMNSNKISCHGKNLFNDYNLMELAKYRPQVKKEEMKDFIEAIFDQLSVDECLMIQRDWYELETYMALLEDSLSEKNIKVVTDRVCSMILNAYKRNVDKISPHRYSAQRSNYSGNYSRLRKIYKPSTGHRY